MNINDFDKNLTNDEIISKADNIYMMLYTAYMIKDLSRVDHKISDEVMNKYVKLVEDDKNNNVIHMFDQLNVKTTNIINIEETEDKIIVTIELVSRYLNYFLDQNTRKFIKGDINNREEHTNIMTLEKNKRAMNAKSIMVCPGCSHSIDVSYSGKCEFCGQIFNTEKYDYVLTHIETR